MSGTNTASNRRKVLKSITAGTGAVIAGKSLPENWTKPFVNSVLLPAHAETTDDEDSGNDPQTYAIGDTGPCGGIVFYISNGGLNGMEAAPVDQATAPWGCFGTLIGTGTGIGSGAGNTAAILSGCGDSPIAAEIASNYAGGGCTDWYLPALDELSAMYTELHLNGLGGFADDHYWSSSEYSSDSGRKIYFGNGSPGDISKNDEFRARAIRSF